MGVVVKMMMKHTTAAALLAVVLLTSGCASQKDDSAYALAFYRKPPKRPGKSLTPCVATSGHTMRVDRTVPLSEASNSEDVALVTGRYGRTAAIGAGAARGETVEAPWGTSAALRSSDRSLSPDIGGPLSETRDYNGTGATVQIGQPGCCSGLPNNTAPR